MMESQNGRIKFCNVICALLALCLVVLQFTPFWHFGNKSLSINSYIWFECNNPEIEEEFITQLGSLPNINSIVLTSILVLLLGTASVVVCIVKSEVVLAALLPAATSLSALYAFAFKPVFRLGSTWTIQLILSSAMLLFAAMALVFGFYKNKSVEAGKKE